LASFAKYRGKARVVMIVILIHSNRQSVVMANLNEVIVKTMYVTVAKRLRQAYPTLLEWGSILANSNAQNMPSFRRWQFEVKLRPFF
jgi:hypothetical protein